MMVDELDKIYDMVCKIAELKKSDIKNDRSKAILLGLEKIKQQLDATNSNQRRIERRIKAIAKVLIAFAKLDFSKKTHLC